MGGRRHKNLAFGGEKQGGRMLQMNLVQNQSFDWPKKKKNPRNYINYCNRKKPTVFGNDNTRGAGITTEKLQDILLTFKTSRTSGDSLLYIVVRNIVIIFPKKIHENSKQ